jgi:photosystem II stability/assembly factor-like uncharacterized protein
VRQGLSKLASLFFVGLIFLPVQLARANQGPIGAIYAATNNGVFKSTNGGASWTVANSGLAGNVFSLAIDPSNPSTLYAGTDGSHVFKSTNGGQSWIAASSGLEDTIVLSLAIDPANPNTLYAGTATSAFFPGSGVFKSIDAAQTWTASNSGLPVAIIDVLRIDPSNPATLYAGTNFAGVFKSTNGGQSWTAANSGMTNALIEDLAVDPVNPTTLYAAIGGCSFNCSLTAGVFKSTNGGMSWAGVNSGITDLQVVSLAVEPSDTNILYAGTRLHGVFKSIDGGASWTPVNPDLSSTLFAIIHLPLAVDPLNPGIVYAGTVNGVFKSTDSGMNWTSANTGFPASTSIFELAIEPAAAATSVEIDIKPGSSSNSINPRSNGNIPVAVLTTSSFDASSVDPGTVRFGQTGKEAAQLRSSQEDVDKDGDLDLVLHFNTQQSGLKCGDSLAHLTGRTFDGQPVTGSDSVRTAGCHMRDEREKDGEPGL